MTATAQEDHVPKPTGLPWSKKPEPKGAATQIAELKTLVVDYAKQETVDPLKTLGRYLGFGIAGSVLLGTGIFLLLLALLRGLQEIAFFQDSTWTWLPYLITALTGAIIVALFLMKLMRMASSSSSPAPAPTSRGVR
ncbi:MAG: phage holin family protein [Microthrixaceae bacterium]